MSEVSFARRHAAGIVALVLVVAAFFISRPPSASTDERADLARRYGFEPMSIAMPGGFAQQSIRRVNQDYKHIEAWMSSVGSGIAMNDLDGDGLANDLCITDPRIDQVVVTPTPGAGSDRYPPFVLSYGSLPVNHAMAPMGCAPGDFNEDGRMDLLVYLWGRTPILHLARETTDRLSATTYVPTELVPGATGGEYNGPQWNSNAVAIDDFDGDGHVDIYLGNYFKHSPILDYRIAGGVAMNASLSRALNGGEDYIFRWTGASAGDQPTARFELVDDAMPLDVSRGWVLAAAANDLDGDMLPELYIAQDHGPDRLLHNRSTPGKIQFRVVEGARRTGVPKSKEVGRDSFKGMGIDFNDFNGDGMYDMFVSNITTSFGVEESNHAFVNTAHNLDEVRRRMREGEAPFVDKSTSLGVAWAGWGWDAKFGDFDNSGVPAVVQTVGFMKGEVNRWPQLQELASANDLVVPHTAWWPRFVEGDDVAGSQTISFFVKGKDRRYANIAKELGLAVPVPTRGVATGDADGDGRLDLAIARQWDQPVFYRNTTPASGRFLGLRLQHEGTPGFSPVVGAQVVVTTPDGRKLLGRVDGGSGHSGKRSHEVHIGLADVAGPVQVSLCWRDRGGGTHKQELQLSPGWHSVQLGSTATVR